MTSQPLLIVILAAGRGTRMKSAIPKVLHQVAGRSLLGHALALSRAADATRVAVVIGPQMETVAAEVEQDAPRAEIFVQREQLGTAHALLAARAALKGHDGDVVVVFADTPLLTAATIARLRATLDGGAAIGVLGFEPLDASGYGRLIVDARGQLLAIREEEDASDAERSIRLCNSGVMAFRTRALVDMLERIDRNNAGSEYYLTDVVEVARRDGLSVAVAQCPADEVMGINSRDQLAAAEDIWQRCARQRVMREGASLVAPETVWFSHDTVVGRDVRIEPNVYIGPGVVIEDGVTIKANCHLVGIDRKSSAGVRLRKGAEVGPFARFRPGADIGPDASIGNFVEVKNARFEDGAKASHLAYIGDARVGRDANIGAGTITCNYNGFAKGHTDIGAGAFIGSNTALVAPVAVGDDAYVGAGSVISGRNVEAGSLAVVRGERQDRPGWVATFKALMEKRKARK